MKHEFQPETFEWSGISPSVSRVDRDSTWGNGYRGVTRCVISGDRGEPCSFHVRYYEVEPGGYTRLERHEHIHSVTIVRGQGYAVVGSETYRVGPFDHVYVAPLTFHQFVNDTDQPFGFLCVVDAQRDRPQEPSAADIAQLEKNPATAGKFRL